MAHDVLRTTLDRLAEAAGPVMSLDGVTGGCQPSRITRTSMLSWMPLRAGLEGIHGGAGRRRGRLMSMLPWMPLRAGLEGIHGGAGPAARTPHVHAPMDALARRP